MSEQKAMRRKGDAAGGEEQIPLVGALCHGRQSPVGHILLMPHSTYPDSGQDRASLCAPILSLSAGWSAHPTDLSPAHGT